MPEDYPPIPMGLVKYMQPKRVAQKHREGVLPFKVAWIAAGQREQGDHVQACPGTPVGILQLECYGILCITICNSKPSALHTDQKQMDTQHLTLGRRDQCTRMR